jgi:hypothetical protein
MRAVNIRIATIKKMYEQFVKLERKHIGDTTPGWRWCLSAYCNAGQVHNIAEKETGKSENMKTEQGDGSTYDSAIDLDDYEPEVVPAGRLLVSQLFGFVHFVHSFTAAHPVVELPGDPNICTCYACGARACVRCDRPYHAGETCKAYQLRTKDRMEEEDQTMRAIERATKACPNCRVRIQKNGGCPHMCCK